MFNKSLTTNIVSLVIIAVSYLSPKYNEIIYLTGLFALSGGITNWLAIHMLFEKVPGFYGSGVIPARFEDFKEGIHRLIMKQFFTADNVARFFKGNQTNDNTGVDLSPLIDSVNLDPTFEALKKAVMDSKFGGALAMFGGTAALDPIKPDFVEKMKSSVKEIVSSNDFQEKIQALLTGGQNIHSELLDRIGTIVEKRLEELTPTMVKEIIQQMIRTHLGWLVVWGGVCGGLIGLIASLFRQAW